MLIQVIEDSISLDLCRSLEFLIRLFGYIFNIKELIFFNLQYLHYINTPIKLIVTVI